MVAKLPLVSAAPPAPVRRQLGNVAQIVACRYVRGEELVGTANVGLAHVTEHFSQLLALGQLVTTSAVHVPLVYPADRASGAVLLIWAELVCVGVISYIYPAT